MYIYISLSKWVPLWNFPASAKQGWERQVAAIAMVGALSSWPTGGLPLERGLGFGAGGCNLVAGGMLDDCFVGGGCWAQAVCESEELPVFGGLTCGNSGWPWKCPWEGSFLRDSETTIKRRKSSKNACFRGKRHDNKILKVEILLSRILLSLRRLLLSLPTFWAAESLVSTGVRGVRDIHAPELELVPMGQLWQEATAGNQLLAAHMVVTEARFLRHLRRHKSPTIWLADDCSSYGGEQGAFRTRQIHIKLLREPIFELRAHTRLAQQKEVSVLFVQSYRVSYFSTRILQTM